MSKCIRVAVGHGVSLLPLSRPVTAVGLFPSFVLQLSSLFVILAGLVESLLEQVTYCGHMVACVSK